jgi:hypothetical protein
LTTGREKGKEEKEGRRRRRRTGMILDDWPREP